MQNQDRRGYPTRCLLTPALWLLKSQMPLRLLKRFLNRPSTAIRFNHVLSRHLHICTVQRHQFRRFLPFGFGKLNYHHPDLTIGRIVKTSLESHPLHLGQPPIKRQLANRLHSILKQNRSLLHRFATLTRTASSLCFHRLEDPIKSAVDS